MMLKQNKWRQTQILLVSLTLLLISCGNQTTVTQDLGYQKGAFKYSNLRLEGSEIIVDYIYECPVRGWGSDGTACNFPFEETGTFFVSSGRVFFSPSSSSIAHKDQYLLFDFTLKPGEHKDVFLHNEEVHTFLWSINRTDITSGGNSTFLLTEFCNDGKNAEFTISPQKGILSYRSFESIIFYAPDSITEIQDFIWYQASTF